MVVRGGIMIRNGREIVMIRREIINGVIIIINLNS